MVFFSSDNCTTQDGVYHPVLYIWGCRGNPLKVLWKNIQSLDRLPDTSLHHLVRLCGAVLQTDRPQPNPITSPLNGCCSWFVVTIISAEASAYGVLLPVQRSSRTPSRTEGQRSLLVILMQGVCQRLHFGFRSSAELPPQPSSCLCMRSTSEERGLRFALFQQRLRGALNLCTKQLCYHSFSAVCKKESLLTDSKLQLRNKNCS